MSAPNPLPSLQDEVRALGRLLGVPEISRADVELVWEPKWTPHRISAAGREQLHL